MQKSLASSQTSRFILIRPRASLARPSVPTNYVRWKSSVDIKEYKYKEVSILLFYFADFEMKNIDENGREDPHFIVDVREPYEWERGAIPSSINIPFKSSPEALAMSEKDFFKKFGFDKPELYEEVIFYCQTGIRSTAAAEFAKANGYKR